jgi:hypothetical protein
MMRYQEPLDAMLMEDLARAASEAQLRDVGMVERWEPGEEAPRAPVHKREPAEHIFESAPLEAAMRACPLSVLTQERSISRAGNLGGGNTRRR